MNGRHRLIVFLGILSLSPRARHAARLMSLALGRLVNHSCLGCVLEYD
jgi:hypothetical protein